MITRENLGQNQRKMIAKSATTSHLNVGRVGFPETASANFKKKEKRETFRFFSGNEATKEPQPCVCFALRCFACSQPNLTNQVWNELHSNGFQACYLHKVAMRMSFVHIGIFFIRRYCEPPSINLSVCLLIAVSDC